MKLTDGEKLILLMLADMYKNLKIKGDFDSEFISNTIHNDYLWGFSWKYSGIPFEKSASPGEVTETSDYLDMWYLLEISYDKLSGADKKKVKAVNNNSDVRFPGFDGNNEDHMGISHYLIEQLERYEHFKGKNLNSHMSSVPLYSRMYSVFKPMRASIGSGHLSADQIIKILNGGR
jgi:uncharacterized protein YfbU (UPF0304 family)